MPLYEYVCVDCDTKFEELRPLGRMDDPASCPQGHPAGRRVFSMFAALTKTANGESSPISGGGCGGCGGGCMNCACGLN